MPVRYGSSPAPTRLVSYSYRYAPTRQHFDSVRKERFGLISHVVSAFARKPVFGEVFTTWMSAVTSLVGFAIVLTLSIGLQPPRMFSLQSFVNRIGRSNRENGHLVSESTHRSCGLAPRQLRCQCLPILCVGGTNLFIADGLTYVVPVFIQPPRLLRAGSSPQRQLQSRMAFSSSLPLEV